jgi:hypothetical protein
MKKSKIEICYLCGKKLDKEEAISRDHVPPRQFYPSAIRKNTNLNLFTLPTHTACNKSYQKDEDYFVNSLGPLAKSSYAGNELWEDISHQMSRSESKKLILKILKEFERRPSGIILPHGKVGKRYNVKRTGRIIWKITRGLFYKEKEKILPEDTIHYIGRILGKYEKPTEELILVASTAPSKGQYFKVFDYKYINQDNLYLWAMRFWDSLTVSIMFKYPVSLSK